MSKPSFYLFIFIVNFDFDFYHLLTELQIDFSLDNRLDKEMGKILSY